MKFCGSSELLLSIAVIFVLSFGNGCGDSNSETPSVANRNSQSVTATVDDSSDENAGSSTSSTSSGEPVSNDLGGASGGSGAASKMGSKESEYAPIFTKGLDQLTISSRMERNFNRHFQKGEKSDFYHFKSAGLRMRQPENFILAKNYTGFETAGASLSILTSPFSMKDTTDNVIEASMNQANSGILFLKDVEIDGYEGKFYVNVTQGLGGIEVANLSLAFGDDTFSWIAKATFLTTDEMRDDIGANILEGMLSARVADEPRLPPGEDVAFAIRPNILKLNDGFIDKLVFTKGGKFPINRVDEPIFQVSRLPKKVNESDRKKFAQLVMSPTPLFKVELVSSETDVEIDGMKGYEFVAHAIDTASKEPLQLFSVVLFEEKAAYLMSGWVSSLNTDHHIKDFRELSRSLRRKPSTEDEKNSG